LDKSPPFSLAFDERCRVEGVDAAIAVETLPAAESGWLGHRLAVSDVL
jgi:hypothetical protein